MRKRVLLVLVVAAAAVGAEAQSEGLRVSGNVVGSAAYRALRNTAFCPAADALLPDFSAGSTASVSVEAGERSRLSLEACSRIDAVARAVTFEVLRAYAEARVGDFLFVGIGRRLIGFGCGLTWNPVNGLDTPRDPFDRNATRPGTDGVFASLDLGKATGFPLSLSVEGLPPPFTPGIDVAESTVAAQAYVYGGGVEVGIVGDCADPAGARPRWSAGAWGTVDIAGLVLGFEAAWRASDGVLRPDSSGSPVPDTGLHASALGCASARLGDFFWYAEALYSESSLTLEEAVRLGSAPPGAIPSWASVASPGAIGRWHAAAGAQWTRDEWALEAGGLWDIEEKAGAVSASGSWAVDDRAIVRLGGVIPMRGATVSEYHFLPYGWAASLSVEVYF